MKHKMIAIFTLLLLLSACGRTEIPGGSPSNGPGVAPETPTDTAPPAPITQPTATGTFDSAAFPGKIRSCAYAGERKVLVGADQISLYDTQTDEVIATATIDLRDIIVSSFSDGYLVVGHSEAGICGVLFDPQLGNETWLSFEELLGEDFLLSADGVSISPDGTTIALAGFHGLYLYDREHEELSTLLMYEENTEVNSTRIGTISSLAFVHQGEKLAYIGQGFPVPQRDGVDAIPIYGMVSIGGDNLRITKSTSYTASELLVGGDQIIMPQSFIHNNGTLLTIDGVTQQETLLRFSTDDEGGDGVFASAQGQYVATAVLEEDLTIRIYGVGSGALLHTETIEHSNSAYFNRVPKVLLLDESKTCIVLLGCGMDDVDTWSVTFGFEES